MNVDRKQILAALSTVEDPDLKKDLVSLGMIEGLEVEGRKIRFRVVLTTPACPLKEKIRQDCLQAVRKVAPEYEIDIEMTANVTTVQDRSQLKNIRNVIAVASGKGGVGKSTVAANLAVALAKSGAKTGLVDADIYGPSVPIMFGLQGERPYVHEKEGKDWIIPFEKHGIKLMSIGFLVPPGKAIVWRGPMASKGMSQLIFDSDWGELDYLVVDLPPGTGDIHLSLVQQLPVTGVVIVTTPQDVALEDTRKGAEMFQSQHVNVPILGVVENMSWFTPEDMPDKKYFIFGSGGGKKLATELNVSLLAQIPVVESIRATGDSGAPVATVDSGMLSEKFGELASSVAQQIAIRNAGTPPTEPVQMKF